MVSTRDTDATRNSELRWLNLLHLVSSLLWDEIPAAFPRVIVEVMPIHSKDQGRRKAIISLLDYFSLMRVFQQFVPTFPQTKL